MLDGARGFDAKEMWTASMPSKLASEDEAWRACDQRLRRNAKRRASLDAEECELLRDAERLQIWRPLGMVSMIDYMERVLGYPPETAQKRLRVARRLGELPVLSDALREGTLSFSAVRELTRVATPATEVAWRDAAAGASNLREIEALVSGHAPGDLPDDPRTADAQTHTVTFELSASTYALLRQARLAVDEANGSRVDDDALLSAMAHAVLEAQTTAVEPSGRAKFQIALTVCERCNAGTQHGAGAAIPVDAATVERAHCDAQHIGSLRAPVPARAYQDIPPSVARFVWHRDGGRCQTPGCRSSHGLEIHHIVARKDGGTNDPSNLTLRCASCHIAHHEGRITIAGTAPDKLTLTRREDTARDCPRDRHPENPRRRPDVSRRSSTSSPDALATSTMRAQARDALAALGWKKQVASAAVDAALASTGTNIAIDALIREALRRCAVPSR